VSGLDLTQVVGWLNLTGFTMSLALIALYVVVALRLIAGPFARLVPVSAWVLGALGGVALLAQRVLSPIGVWLRSLPDQAALVEQVSVAIQLLGYVAWPLLVVAALLGLGRGMRARRVRSPLRRLYVVDPTD